MELVIVTGLSGAGKSAALDVLEDAGFLCIDNLPTPLLPQMVSLMHRTPEVQKVALAIDQRNRVFGEELYLKMKEWKADFGAKILFFTAEDETLIKRFKERRRLHPLLPNGSIAEGVSLERQAMQAVSELSSVIDTSKLSLGELKHRILSLLGDNVTDRLHVLLTTFGFKYGIVVDADIVFDVRFIQNPYYVPSMKERSGYEEDVYEFVLAQEGVKEFLERVYDLLVFLIPLYKKEGKDQLSVAIGCTGGSQRSVTIARKLEERLKENGIPVLRTDRDLEAR